MNRLPIITICMTAVIAVTGCGDKRESSDVNAVIELNGNSESDANVSTNDTVNTAAAYNVQDTPTDMNGGDGVEPDVSANVVASANDAEAQIDFIYNNTAEWLRQNNMTHYAITDLDHNGRLEVLAVDHSGTADTMLSIYEINGDMTGYNYGAYDMILEKEPDYYNYPTYRCEVNDGFYCYIAESATEPFYIIYRDGLLECGVYDGISFGTDSEPVYTIIGWTDFPGDGLRQQMSDCYDTFIEE